MIFVQLKLSEIFFVRIKLHFRWYAFDIMWNLKSNFHLCIEITKRRNVKIIQSSCVVAWSIMVTIKTFARVLLFLQYNKIANNKFCKRLLIKKRKWKKSSKLIKSFFVPFRIYLETSSISILSYKYCLGIVTETEDMHVMWVDWKKHVKSKSNYYWIHHKTL